MQKKILIIEDDKDVAKLLAARLGNEEYETVIAVDAVQGVQLAHQQKPHLIILDLMLPAGGGMSVLENLETSIHVGYIPVIVLTGIKDDEYKSKVMKKGVKAYFEKPYNAEELINAINSILKS
ncbi:MAG: response regulator [Candidatus Omnitrophota bacterium]